MGANKLKKYPSSESLHAGRQPPAAGPSSEPRCRADARKLIDAEKAAGRTAAPACARRAIVSTREISPDRWRSSPRKRRIVPLRRFRLLHRDRRSAGVDGYRGYDVYKNLLGAGPRGARAEHPRGLQPEELGHNSAAFIHTSAEALKLAFGDREKYLGDMAFIKIPYEGLLSKETAERRTLIDPDKASLELRPGDPTKFMKKTDALVRPVHVTTTGRPITSATPATSPSWTRIGTWSASSRASTAAGARAS